jgi:hypothetical protein
MIEPMRDLGRRLLIGLGVVAVAVMAIGYAYIFGGIATPVGGDLGVLAVPASGTASAVLLDDGRPVFVVNDAEGGVWVIDAQRPQAPGTLGLLISWCPQTRRFVDPGDGAVYAPDGRLLAGPADRGLVAFASRPAPEDPASVVVGSDTELRGQEPAGGEPPAGCPGRTVVHEPQPDETFDPSVAAEAEPPGWIWIDGTLRVIDGEVRLCDGQQSACEGFAPAVGIDPASLADDAVGVGGRFIGRVRDGAIEGLILVPDPMEAS